MTRLVAASTRSPELAQAVRRALPGACGPAAAVPAQRPDPYGYDAGYRSAGPSCGQCLACNCCANLACNACCCGSGCGNG